MHTTCINKLEKAGIKFPKLHINPSMPFDQYIDEKLFMCSQVIFSTNKYLQKNISSKFLRCSFSTISLITIADNSYTIAINKAWHGPKNADYYGLFISEDTKIFKGYEKITGRKISLSFEPVNTINTDHDMKNDFIIYISEKWISSRTIGGHALIAHVDVRKKIVSLFDPSQSLDHLDRIGGYILTRYFKGFKANNLIRTPDISFQSINSKLFFTSDIYCATWSLMMGVLFDMNNTPPKKIVQIIYDMGEKARYLMIYFGYILYETSWNEYQMTKAQTNQLSLHKKLVNDMKILKIQKDPIYEKILSFVRLYDFMVFSVETIDNIKISNPFLEYNVKELVNIIEKAKTKKQKPDLKKEKDFVMDFLNDMHDYMHPIMYKKAIYDSLNCVLF
jgi:hypothetical protein